MTYNVKISNPIIKVNGNLAWAEYNQIITTYKLKIPRKLPQVLK